eukprot:1210993-Prymnesium_polylepis.1
MDTTIATASLAAIESTLKARLLNVRLQRALDLAEEEANSALAEDLPELSIAIATKGDPSKRLRALVKVANATAALSESRDATILSGFESSAILSRTGP